jgi:hypothetical protein
VQTIFRQSNVPVLQLQQADRIISVLAYLDNSRHQPILLRFVMVNFRATAFWMLAPLLMLATSVSLGAAEEVRPWYKYENKYFEAYSDASEKDVRQLLEDLENFRAAVIQLNGSRVPEGSVKTRVIIFRSKEQYRGTINRDSIDAYTVGIQGVPYIVMSTEGMSEWSRITIRHEFNHVLQGYSGALLPLWYFEGFAEFMSGMTFRNKNTEFVVGGSSGRRKSHEPLVDWDKLISDEFRFDQISSSAQASNAYFQSGLLVRYLWLADDFAHKEGLNKYLALYSEGETSTDAFSEVFGESANEMGSRVYKQYRKRFDAKARKFLPESQDHNFVRSAVALDTVVEFVDELNAIDRGQSD